MLALGFTNEEIVGLLKQESWSPADSTNLILDVAKPGGFDRVFRLYRDNANSRLTRPAFLIYQLSDAWAQEMKPQALAIARQATTVELQAVKIYMSPGWRPVSIIDQVLSERRKRLAVWVGTLSGSVLGIGTLVWWRRRRAS